MLAATPSLRVRLAPSYKGSPTAFYDRDGAPPVPLHSRYDPLQESRLALKEIDLEGSDYFTCLGFGLGYGLDALLERVSAGDVRIFVVESDLEILRAAMSARDLSALLSLPHIHFAWPPTGDDLAQQWVKFFDPARARQSIFVSHPPSMVLNPDLYKSAAEILRSKTLQIFTDINTLIGKAPVFLDNFVANIRAAGAAPGISAFRGRFENVPAVLVSAGPSLDRNIHHLRACQDQALILAADTALKPLLAAGIQPHFVMSGDPGPVNHLHLKGADARLSYLVADATAYPATLKMFAGRTILCRFENATLQALSELLASKGTLRAWGSVATMCLDFALQTGCNPIIFAGQDLAYSEGRMYCSGLHWDGDWFEAVHDPDEWQNRWAELRAQGRLVQTDDVFRRPVESTEKLISYWNWIGAEIEKNPGTQFINATEGGILRSNLQIMSLREALHRYGCRNRNLRNEVDNAFALAVEEPGNIDTALLSRLDAEHVRLRRLLSRGLDLCRASTRPADMAGRLNKVRQAIYDLKTLMPLVDRFNQMGNLRFMRRLDSRSSGGNPPEDVQGAYQEFLESIAGVAQQLAPQFAALRKSLAP